MYFGVAGCSETVLHYISPLPISSCVSGASSNSPHAISSVQFQGLSPPTDRKLPCHQAPETLRAVNRAGKVQRRGSGSVWGFVPWAIHPGSCRWSATSSTIKTFLWPASYLFTTIPTWWKSTKLSFERETWEMGYGRKKSGASQSRAWDRDLEQGIDWEVIPGNTTGKIRKRRK